MYGAIDQQLAAAWTAAQQALHELQQQNNHQEMHLPIDDVRIAMRFLELARERLAKVGGRPDTPATAG